MILMFNYLQEMNFGLCYVLFANITIFLIFLRSVRYYYSYFNKHPFLIRYPFYNLTTCKQRAYENMK